jgi:pimeloyl-ACP methyl ester carboxylesterase
MKDSLGSTPTESGRVVRISAGPVALDGNLTVPADARGVVLFAHGSGSSRHSPRNRYVGGVLHQHSLATLLFDLLTAEEERADAYTGHLRFDIGLLSERLVAATVWACAHRETAGLPVGYFGASTGAAAALVAAAARPQVVQAVVSRGGRPDLAGKALAYVQAATQLIVGGADVPVIGMNQEALTQLGVADKKLVIVPGATHLFEEPGALQEVARLAAEWLGAHLKPARG